MRAAIALICVALLIGCGDTGLKDTAAPPAPPVKKLTDAEVAAGTSTDYGTVTPKILADNLGAGAGAPTDVDYLVGTADAGLSAEEVVSANGLTLVKAADYAAMKALLDLEIGEDVLAQQAIGTADDNLVEIDDAGGGVDGEYPRFTADGLESRSPQEVIYELVVLDWDFTGANAMSMGPSSIGDGIQTTVGDDSDWTYEYDEDGEDRLEYVHAAGAGADVYWDLNDSAADSTYTVTNTDGTYEANLSVEGDIAGGGVVTGASVVIGDAGNIGSASDTDAIAIAANGEVTLSQELQAGAGIDLGTSQAIVGTTGLTIGNNGQTVAINSSDWDIDATGAMTGIGNITSDGTITDGTFSVTAGAFTGVASMAVSALTGVDSIANGDEDLDIGGAEVDDVTIITDGGSVVIDGTITLPEADNPYIMLDDDDDADFYIINDDAGEEIEFSTDSTVGSNNMATLNQTGTFTSVAGVTVGTILATTPQSLEVTTEADITLTSSLLLLTGDNDTDNDTIDLQDGTVAGQQLTIVGVAAIDADDTITVAMTDTTCTGCLTVLIDEIGDTWGLVWTGTTWATVSNSEVP